MSYELELQKKNCEIGGETEKDNRHQKGHLKSHTFMAIGETLQGVSDWLLGGSGMGILPSLLSQYAERYTHQH